MHIPRIWRVFEKEVQGLHEVAYLLGVFALLSQVLALVRDRLLAHAFGAGGTLDIYYAAFRIPDFIFVTVASLFSVSILVPFLARARTEGEEEARSLMASVYTLFVWSMLLSGVVAFMLVPFLVSYLFPGFVAGENEATLIMLTRLLLLQPVFLGFSGLLASISQLSHRFLLYAVSPLLYNIGIITGILFLYPLFGIYGLGMGVVLGALCHALVQVPFVYSQKFFALMSPRRAFSRARLILLHALPRTLALASGQIVLLVFAGFASRMGEGALAAFTFAFNLQSIPLSIIAVSYVTAAFPVLARTYAEGDRASFHAESIRAARYLLFWTIPALVFFIMLRVPIVRVLLGSGAFDARDTHVVAAALALFALSLFAQSLLLLFIRSYYAAGKTLVPLLVSAGTALGAIGFALLFSKWFTEYAPFSVLVYALLSVEHIPGTIMLMLPLAFALAHLLGALLIMALFSREYGAVFRPLARVLGEGFLGAAMLGASIWIVLYITKGFFGTETVLGTFLQGLCAGTAGMGMWALTLFLLKSKELKEVGNALRAKVLRALGFSRG